MAAPRIRHQNALRRLANVLDAAAPPDLLVVEGIGVILPSDQRPIPDLVVIRGADPDSDLSNVPAEQVLLAAEVVSRSSRTDDRLHKPLRYARAGIAVYLRVELDPADVVAYRLGADGRYAETGRAGPGLLLTLAEPFPVTVDVAALLR